MKPSVLEQRAASAAQVRDADMPRERRRETGVVHTPPLLARALVHAADVALREAGRPQGLLDPAVFVVDPACGPGAFVAAVLTLARARGRAPGRLIACDLDPSATASVVHTFTEPARASGCDLQTLTFDALAEYEALLLACEGAEVVAVLGNPPWTTSRRKATPSMQQLLGDFRVDEHGTRLPERKLGVLSDAYVRFFRTGAELVRQAPGGGVLAFWSNASFIDGPVHRGMRRCLSSWFDAITLVDFGGNAMLARDGARDDNLFAVRPSIALSVATRTVAQRMAKGTVRHVRVGGAKREKEAWLERLLRSEVPPAATVLTPSAPDFPFRPTRPVARAYRDGIGLHEAMPFHREGIQTNRDALVIAADRATLVRRMRALRAGEALEVEVRESHHFSLARAREALAAEPNSTLSETVRPIAYRPLDTRYFIAHPALCHRPRPALLGAMAKSSFALVSVRKDRGSAPYRHIAAVAQAPDSSFLSARSSCRTRAFPECTPDGAENLDAQARALLEERAERPLGVRDVAAYALGLLANEAYCARHGEALHADYARLVLPRTAAQFELVRGSGARLLEAFLGAAEMGYASEQVAAQGPSALLGHHRLLLAEDDPLANALSIALRLELPAPLI